MLERKDKALQEAWDEEVIDLFDLMMFLLRKWKTIAATSILGAVLAAIYVSFIATPMYEATAQVYVVSSKDSALNLSDLQIGSYLTSDYQLVFNTWEVNMQVIQNLNLPYSVEQMQAMVDVENPSNTRALMITCKSPNAQEAAVIANEFADVGSKYISDTMLTDMPTILSTALQPMNPVSPRKTITVVLGFAVGFILSAACLFIFYMSNDKIKTSADVLKCTGAEPLAVIPLMRGDRSGERGMKRW